MIDAFNGRRLLQVGPKPGEPACPPVPDELSPLADGVRRRAEFGMRADPAYVQSLLDRGHLFTKAELRWLNEVGTFDNDDKVETYLRRHAADYSGYTILATYPATADDRLPLRPQHRDARGRDQAPQSPPEADPHRDRPVHLR